MAALAFLAVAINLVAGAIGFEGAEERSYLEGRTYQKFPELNGESLASGDFQDKFGQFVADSIPKRDDVLLADAGVQRLAIHAANAPFGFAVYPTFFGSKYNCYPGRNAIIQTPTLQSAMPSKTLAERSRDVAALMDANSDIDWYIAVPTRITVCDFSPLNELVSNAATFSYFGDHYLGPLKEHCTVVDISCDSLDSYFETYYKTDHHWMINGAVDAYRAIVEAMGKDAVPFGRYITAYDGEFYGSHSRSGRDIELHDSVADVQYEHGDISVIANGKAQDISYAVDSWADGFSGYEKPQRFANVYADYFHGDDSLLEYHNSGVNEGSLLILGDSYTDCMDRFFAESWRDVYVLDLRSFGGSIQDFIDSHQIDDALILMSANNLLDKTVAKKLSGE